MARAVCVSLALAGEAPGEGGRIPAWSSESVDIDNERGSVGADGVRPTDRAAPASFVVSRHCLEVDSVARVLTILALGASVTFTARLRFEVTGRALNTFEQTGGGLHKRLYTFDFELTRHPVEVDP